MTFLSGFYTTALHDYDITHDDVTYSFLPLAHCFEMFCNMKALYKGASVGYFCGNIMKLTEDLSVLKPTMMPIVPWVLMRLHDGFLAKIHSLEEEK